MTEIRLGEADVGRRLSLRVGDLVHVELKETSTSGYAWRPASATATAFETLSDERDPGVAPGAAAVRRFVFRVRAAGDLSLVFVLRRPWTSEDFSSLAFRILAT